MKCIWCLNETAPSASEEHIIPESLGCPAGLVFKNGEVCSDCNSRLSLLDQAITAEFDIARIVAGVPNKRGKPAEIATRSNAEGGRRDGRPFINVNMERKITVQGQKRQLKPFAGRRSDLNLEWTETSPGMATASVTQDGVCNTRTCVRALHKIALSVFA
jgi:hypothetical protein